MVIEEKIVVFSSQGQIQLAFRDLSASKFSVGGLLAG